MKLYNPFKWHIIEQYGRFWVRKLSIVGWLFMSKNDSVFHWCSADPCCSFYSLEDASVKLSKYPELLKKYKDHQKIKVHV